MRTALHKKRPKGGISKREIREAVMAVAEREKQTGYVICDKKSWPQVDIFLHACRAGRRPYCYLYRKPTYDLVVGHWQTKYEEEGFSKQELEEIAQLIEDNPGATVCRDKEQLTHHYIQLKMAPGYGEIFAQAINSMFTCPKEYQRVKK